MCVYIYIYIYIYAHTLVNTTIHVYFCLCMLILHLGCPKSTDPPKSSQKPLEKAACLRLRGVRLQHLKKANHNGKLSCVYVCYPYSNMAMYSSNPIYMYMHIHITYPQIRKSEHKQKSNLHLSTCHTYIALHDMHAYIHTCIHYIHRQACITLHDGIIHYNTIRYITLHHPISLHCITLHKVTLQNLPYH